MNKELNIKDLEGKEVFLQPSGNNIRRHNHAPKKAVVVSVAKVNIDVLFEGHDRVQKYRVAVHGDGRTHISNDGNSGYYVYENESALKNRLFNESLSLKLISFSKDDWANCDAEVMRQIASLLKLDVET